MKQRLLPVALASLLSACASTASIESMETRVDGGYNEAVQHLDSVRRGQVERPSPVRVIDDAYYMPIQPVQTSAMADEPLNCRMEFNPVVAASLQEIAQAISESCGIRVRITNDAHAAVRMMRSDQAGTQSSSLQAAQQAQPAPQLPEIDLNGNLPPMMGLPMMSSGPDRSDHVSIAWSGDVSGLLDAVTSRLGLSWRHRDGVVSVFYLDTRTYRVEAIPRSTTMESSVHSGARSSAGISSVGQGGSGGSSAGGISGTADSTQNTSVVLSTDFMADLEETIKQMMTPQAGRMALSRASGTLTVTDTPETLDRITAYIDQTNKFVSRQVLINVKVLSVSVTNGRDYGINWNLIYTKLADQYGLRLANSLGDSREGSVGSVGILEGGSSRFAGSDLILNALSTAGKVSVITEPSVTTLNMSPVPVQVARQVSYLERVELGQTAQVGTTTSLTPGSITTGFNMMLLPHILDDSKTVLLQYSMNLSSLDNLRTVTSGGSSIEIPETDNRLFNQQIRLQSGQTLIVSGYEQLTNDSRRSGVGSPRFWGLGGGAKGNERRDVIVVLITPIVLS